MKKELTVEEKLQLRLAQWEKAMEGDTKMLIFLGKQYLGQTDSPETPMVESLGGVRFVIPQDVG